MLFIPATFLKQITDHAEQAYPDECCGLLVGRDHGAVDLVVTRIEPSPNVADQRRNDRFEVDPAIRFKVMREAEGTNKRLIGHYHSHPDHPAQPSQTDLDQAFEPDLIWMITSVIGGQAVQTTAHVIDANQRQFRHLELRTTDWQPYATRPQTDGAPNA